MVNLEPSNPEPLNVAKLHVSPLANIFDILVSFFYLTILPGLQCGNRAHADPGSFIRY